MKLSLLDRSNDLAAFLPVFQERPLSFSDATRFQERHTARLISTGQRIDDLRTCDFSFLFAYSIFPTFIMRSVQTWQLKGRCMSVGDIIVQQAYLPPLPLSLKCIFAVRILSITQTADFVGFTYGTLVGHAERGTSTFAFVKRGNDLYALIHTFSQPADALARLVAPFFTIPYQQYCTNLAIEQMKARFMEGN